MEAREVSRDDSESLEPLVENGYSIVHAAIAKRHFGDRLIVLEKGPARVRLIKERDKWFAQMGSIEDPNENFDMHIVLRAIGAESMIVPDTHDSLGALCKILATTAPEWEPLFVSDRYSETKKILHSLEIASARERFGFIAE
jgi:hypothetical protein